MYYYHVFSYLLTFCFETEIHNRKCSKKLKIYRNGIEFQKHINDVDITFFAKHSGSTSGMTHHSINGY